MIYDILCIVYYTLIRLPFLSTQNFHTKASRRSHYQLVHGAVKILDVRCVNDPSAGSPTETLLRLHLPLHDKVRTSSCVQVPMQLPCHNIEASPDHSIGRCNGYVYKGQGPSLPPSSRRMSL